jgi:hypothetical protein
MQEALTEETVSEVLNCFFSRLILEEMINPVKTGIPYRCEWIRTGLLDLVDVDSGSP